MRKLFLFSLFLVAGFVAIGQISIVSGGSETACGGTFSAGAVAPGQTYELTICSDGSGDSHISVFFTAWNVVPNNLLCVYDGPDSSFPLIGCYDNTIWGANQAFTATPANLSGCLTFVLTSVDGTASWSGNISCNFSCQPFYSQFVSSDPPADQMYIDICRSESVSFSAVGNYYVNDTLYHQSDANSTFLWDFGDGTTGQGANVSHTFAQPGGYDIGLTITDQHGCINSNYLGKRVRVSTSPVFTGSYIENSASCLGEEIVLHGTVTPTKWMYETEAIVADQTYLPDGDGASYSTSVMFDVFNSDQTLEDINDLEGICANLEHSYLGDIVISVMCPNGTQVVLENQGGDNTYLGEPIDVDDPDQPGVGYDYCWDNNPTYGIMSETAASYSTLPAGSYASFQPLSNLVGCPLNGLWTITVTDNWVQDDGFIFWWGITFNESLYPVLWDFTPTFQEENMSWSGNGVSQQSGSTVSVTPTGYGVQSYTFTAVDDYGCSYDTTILMTVLGPDDPACCDIDAPEAGQNNIVYGNTYQLQATPNDSVTEYSWSVQGPGIAIFSDSHSPTSEVTVNPYGMYIFTFTEDLNGCKASDQVQILFNEVPDTVQPIVVSIPNTFTPNGDGINDTWVISGIDSVENVKVFVYNRYGARVFHSTGFYEPWDGKYMGDVLPTASYYYVVTIRDAGKFNGIINIIGPE